MKNIATLILTVSLLLSMAAPPGAVSALEGVEYSQVVTEVDDDQLAEEGLSTENETEVEGEYSSDGGSSDLDGAEGELPDESDQLDDGQTGSSDGDDQAEGGDSDEATQPDNNPDEKPEGEDEATDPGSEYPQLFISELQVDGECDGGEWCTELGANVEFIELYNPNDFDVSLSGWKLQKQSTGETSQPDDYLEFAEETGLFAGEYAVISAGLAEPAESIVGTLPSNLSNSGGSLFLLSPDGRVVDMLGWGKSAKSFRASPAVAPGQNQSIQRCVKDGSIWLSEPRNDLEDLLIYDDLGPTPGRGIECVEPPVVNSCLGVVLSEIAANVDEQFIEIYNPGTEAVDLSGCQLMTNRSNTKSYVFEEGAQIKPGEFRAILVEEAGLTLTKTTTGTVYLLSSDGLVEASSTNYKGLGRNTSWSNIDGQWLQTYEITPLAENAYQQYLPCDEGYFRNEATGRCNKIVAVPDPVDCGEGRERNPDTGRCRNIPGPRELTPCRDGQYRSEVTNRCRSIAASVSLLKPCADDQFRNPLTNRCKKIASAEDLALADCGEGRERNPETNRCRNVLTSAGAVPMAPFAPEEVSQVSQGMLGWWAFGGLSTLAIGYGVWQWRFEAGRLVRRVAQVLTSGGKS